MPGSGQAASDHDINALTFATPLTRPMGQVRSAIRPAMQSVTITKLTDYASKALHEEFAGKGELPNVLIQFFEPNSDNRLRLVMTMDLRFVRISDDHTFFPPAPPAAPGTPGQASVSQMQRVHESITFMFQSMTRTYAPGQSAATVNLKDWAPKAP